MCNEWQAIDGTWMDDTTPAVHCDWYGGVACDLSQDRFAITCGDFARGLTLSDRFTEKSVLFLRCRVELLQRGVSRRKLD